MTLGVYSDKLWNLSHVITLPVRNGNLFKAVTKADDIISFKDDGPGYSLL